MPEFKVKQPADGVGNGETEYLVARKTKIHCIIKSFLI